MISKKSLNWLLTAAVSAALSGSAMAQYQTVIDGRMREANNRIGSGGSNDGPQPILNPTGNQIITGNVTGGAQFRGAINYTSPTAFRGPTAGDISDNFIKQSSGAPVMGLQSSQNYNAQGYRPYYGPSNAAPAPSGYQIQNPSIGVTSSVRSPYTRAPGDMRLGAVGVSTTALPKPGQLLMPGPVDPTSHNSTYISASPLYGMRQLKPSQSTADQQLLDNSMGANNPQLAGVKMDPALLQKMRSELQLAAQQNQLNNPIENKTLDSDPLTPFDAPRTTPIQQNNLSKPVTPSNNRLQQPANDLSTGASIQQRQLAAPRLQSTQYAELQDRLKQYKIVQQNNDAQAALKFNQQQRAKKAADEAAGLAGVDKNKTVAGARGPMLNVPALPGAQRPGAESNLPATPQPELPLTSLPPVGVGGPVVEPAPATPMIRPAPLKIGSLADGVQAKGLADVLREAESLIKTGKYSSALEQYALAEQVAPNNPLILMGRANVELGRTYYTAAERNLRQAFMQDEALLMAQFDLKSLLGQDRLELVVNDLKTIANREQKESTHVFLLAYIAYNTGNERNAASYLDLAEKRAGGKDPLYQLIRKHWALPTDATAPDLNK